MIINQELLWSNSHLNADGTNLIKNFHTIEISLDVLDDRDKEAQIEYTENISEGIGHLGKSALIGLIARKPNT